MATVQEKVAELTRRLVELSNQLARLANPPPREGDVAAWQQWKVRDKERTALTVRIYKTEAKLDHYQKRLPSNPTVWEHLNREDEWPHR